MSARVSRRLSRRDTCRIASNQEIVERILDLWRELEPIPADLTHGDVEWVNPPDAIEAGTRRGRSGFEEAESAFRRAYRSIEINVERTVESGDTMGVTATVLFRGRGSGIEVPQPIGMLFTILHGRLARFEWSNDPEGLLRALSA